MLNSILGGIESLASGLVCQISDHKIVYDVFIMIYVG